MMLIRSKHVTKVLRILFFQRTNDVIIHFNKVRSIREAAKKNLF